MTTKTTIPAIGETWPGTTAIYAGISLSSDNTHAVHLILWPENDTEECNYDAAIAEAAAVSPDTGSHLPTRIQSITLFQNLRSLFDKYTWYWTSTKAVTGNTAFVQNFYDGYQYGIDLSYEGRVRAVSEIQL